MCKALESKRRKKVQRLMGRIYEPLLVPMLIQILRSTCTSLSDARGASERFKSVGEAQPTEKGMPMAYPFLLSHNYDLDDGVCRSSDNMI